MITYGISVPDKRGMYTIFPVLRVTLAITSTNLGGMWSMYYKKPIVVLDVGTDPEDIGVWVNTLLSWLGDFNPAFPHLTPTKEEREEFMEKLRSVCFTEEMKQDEECAD